MHKLSKQPSALQEKTLNLAVRIVNLSRYLAQDKNEYIISKQILRCGTNPGAMVREAANAETGVDFIHKLGIAQKEAGETLYWLELLHKTNFLTASEYTSIAVDTEEIMKMLRSSILTKKKNLATKAVSAISLIAILVYFAF
ncbi:four helix bundle protein [Spirosoma montaniterrae]|uniref:Four helix bundle protein n=1 Tax=Spirosoma montaniterrae TaxID=1178516 RepID=A0A1P9WVJ5_9BACT|nr:four helix bundle protein [Spirosoma montaniterrae]AQG79391.1 four helix bundle protein [Spirosoma montaniterrae]